MGSMFLLSPLLPAKPGWDLVTAMTNIEYDGDDTMWLRRLYHKNCTHVYLALLGGARMLLSECCCHIVRKSKPAPGGDTPWRCRFSSNSPTEVPSNMHINDHTCEWRHIQMILGPYDQVIWTLNHPSWGVWHGTSEISHPSYIPLEVLAQRFCEHSKMVVLYHSIFRWFATLQPYME